MKQISSLTILTLAIVSAVAALDTLCGRTKIRPYSGGGQIVGGREAKPGSWPWQVSVRLFDTHECSGSLIHPSWVLTSAGCFARNNFPSNWTVMLGEHNLMSEDPNEQEIDIEKIIEHRRFDVNMALIKLRNPVNLTNYVNVVCLPTDLVPDGKKAFVTGFGHKNSKCCPGILKQVKVFIIYRTRCSSRDYLGVEIYKHNVCAAPKGNDTEPCKGDYGGPLVVRDKMRWILVGVSSHRDGCIYNKRPGVYTLVLDFIPWIQETLARYT